MCVCARCEEGGAAQTNRIEKKEELRKKMHLGFSYFLIFVALPAACAPKTQRNCRETRALCLVVAVSPRGRFAKELSSLSVHRGHRDKKTTTTTTSSAMVVTRRKNE